MDAGEGRGRDQWKGKGLWEVETGEIALGEMGERKGERGERWKYGDEKEEENHNRPAWEKRETRHILPPNKTLYLFLYFILLLNVDILQLSCPGSPAPCFLSVFDKGDHGGWSSVDPGARLSLMEECCCLLLRAPRQLETHLWAFLRLLPARSKQLPPSEHIYISPAPHKKNKVSPYIPSVHD